jgi:hypothetical protein
MSELKEMLWQWKQDAKGTSTTGMLNLTQAQLAHILNEIV